MYEEYTDEQIVEMLIPKMNKCSERTKWDGLIEKPWGNADLFKVVATIYRSGYIRGQLGRSFIIERKEKWVPATKDNIRKGDTVKFIDEETGDWYPPTGTIGKVIDVSNRNCFVQWPKGTTSDDGKWWANYYRLEVLVCK